MSLGVVGAVASNGFGVFWGVIYEAFLTSNGDFPGGLGQQNGGPKGFPGQRAGAPTAQKGSLGKGRARPHQGPDM